MAVTRIERPEDLVELGQAELDEYVWRRLSGEPTTPVDSGRFYGSAPGHILTVASKLDKPFAGRLVAALRACLVCLLATPAFSRDPHSHTELLENAFVLAEDLEVADDVVVKLLMAILALSGQGRNRPSDFTLALMLRTIRSLNLQPLLEGWWQGYARHRSAEVRGVAVVALAQLKSASTEVFLRDLLKMPNAAELNVVSDLLRTEHGRAVLQRVAQKDAGVCSLLKEIGVAIRKPTPHISPPKRRLPNIWDFEGLPVTS